MESDVLILGNKWHAYPDLFYWKLPESINVEITNRCDLRCSHCFHSRFRFRQGDLDPRYQQALRSMCAGNPDEAVPGLQELLDVDTRLFEAANALGISLAMAGRKEAARRAFSRALESYPSAGRIRRNHTALEGGQGCVA